MKTPHKLPKCTLLTLALLTLSFPALPTSTSREILSTQLIKMAQVQAIQDTVQQDIPVLGDSIIHRMRVTGIVQAAVNRGSAGATGTEMCQTVRQVIEFQQRRAAVVHFGTNDATEILNAATTGYTLQHFKNRVDCVLTYTTIPIVWGAILPSASATKNALVDTQLNTYIRWACGARQAPTCIFVESPWTQFQQEYFGDNVHPNAAGYSVLYPGYRQGLQQLGIH